MNFIWDNLVNWVLSAMTSAFTYATKGFFSFFNMDLNNFFSFIPIKDLFGIFQGVGLGIAFILAMLTIFGNLFVIITDSHEDSLKVVGRTILAVIAIIFSNEIFNFIHMIFSYPYNLTAFLWNPGTDTNEAPWKDMIERMTQGDNSIAIKIVVIALFIILFKDFFKLLLEAAERYVVICVGAICMPLGMATISTKRTSGVAIAYVKMMINEYILMLFNLVFVKGAIIAMDTYVKAGREAISSEQNITDVNEFAFILLLCAFLTAGAKMDQYMRSLGLDIAQTGSALGNELLATGMGVLAMAKTVTRGVRKGFGKAGSATRGVNRDAGAALGAQGNPIRPNGGGDRGGVFSAIGEKMGFNNSLSNSMANNQNKRISNPQNIANNFKKAANNVTHAGAAASHINSVLNASGNQQLASVGNYINGTKGAMGAVQAVEGGFRITDANGKQATIFASDTAPDVRGNARALYADDGNTLLGYMGNADTGFGIASGAKGDKVALIGDGQTMGIMSEDVAHSLGFSDARGLQAEVLGNNQFDVFDADNNRLGRVDVGNIDSANYGATAINEFGNAIGVETAVDQGMLSDYKFSSADDVSGQLLNHQGNMYDVGTIEDTLRSQYETVGAEDHLSSFISNEDGSAIATMTNGMQLEMNKGDFWELEVSKDLSANEFRGMDSQLFTTPDSQKEFIEATHVVPTSVTGGKNGDGMLYVNGVDMISGQERKVELQDASYLSNSEKGSGIIEMQLGRFGIRNR